MFEQLLAELKKIYSRYINNDNEKFPQMTQLIIETHLRSYVRDMSKREATTVQTIKEEKNRDIREVFYFYPLNYSKLIIEFGKNHEKCQEWKCEKRT